MHRLSIPLLALCASACAATPPPVSLDLYRGVYATHFDGVPNRAAVCAVLTNRAAHDVDWVRLRLRTYPAHSSRKVRWTSYWTYRKGLRPGETRTVRFVRPPVGDQVELEVRDAGLGRGPSSGRPVVDAESCSEPGLQQNVQATQEGRTAPGISFYPIVRRNDPAPVVLVQDH